MAERIDSFVIFSTSPDGFDKNQVAEYIAKILHSYEKLYDENHRLKNELKKVRQSRLKQGSAPSAS